MNRVMDAIRSLLGSMAGREALILTVGMTVASIATLFVADYARIHDFKRARLEAVVASTADIAERFSRDPAGTEALFRARRIFGGKEAPAGWNDMRPDSVLSPMLRQRLGPHAKAEAMLMPRTACFPGQNLAIRTAGIPEQALPDCWYVRFVDARGVKRTMALDIGSINLPRNSTLGPLYPVMILGASALLAFLVARLTTAPLGLLTDAARVFSISADPAPIPERGPSEVRAALRTFNMMQHRVRDGVRERTQILASIAHDLQTPMTRLRLRIEQIEDEAARQKLVDDLGEMQQLVRDGLDLARSIESEETWTVVHIDSILSSVAEDAAEFGAPVRFTGGCNASARVKPNALLRCLNNLIDNAIKYAGDAELGCVREGPDIVISVRDHGPGIPEHALQEAVLPFHRLGAARPTGPGGTGIGLAIVSGQAQTFGAVLVLENHPDGGLLASLRLQAQT